MSHYLHGTNPEEQQRLSRLNDLMNDRCFSKLKIESGNRVLDVGSGLGQMTFKISQTIGENGFCLGVERDENQLTEATKKFRAGNLEFRQGDALQLPLRSNETGTFDFVHCRFLLEHLSNPAKAVDEMVKALKPGGRILLADDDHQAMILYPEPKGFQALWAAYMDSYVEVGNDPFVGRKLPRLLLDAGLQNITNDIVFFGDCARTQTFTLFVNNLIEVIIPSFEVMVSSKSISEKEFNEAIQAIRDWATLPYASIWYTICIAEGVK
jgi:ubiquinone/menaquinone biosynthesis C-methylase UbiE